ncbi:MAG: V-type ATPase subunit [Candidatus Hermodarchaeota archaeon]
MSTIVPSYAYTYIKIAFLRSLIVDDLSMLNFKKAMNINKVLESINPFYPDLNIKKNTIENIELALYHNYIKMVGKIILYSPSNMRLFLKNYLLKFEIMNIKQIIIGSILGIELKKKRKMVNFQVEEYLDNTEVIEDLLKITSLDEFQLYFNKTKYKIPIREGISYFKNYNEIFVLEAFLDKFYYENLISQLRNLKSKEKKIITDFVKYKIEIYNINTIYRGLKNNIEKELLSQFLIDYYLFLDRAKIEYLLNIKDLKVLTSLIEDFVKNFKEIKRYFKIVIDQEHFVHSIEKIYTKYYFKKFKIQIDDIDLITIFRIVELIIKKENEIRFDIIPKVIEIINRKFEDLKLFY